MYSIFANVESYSNLTKSRVETLTQIEWYETLGTLKS